ncbi:MAG: glycosyl transferase [Bacteroidetes bacterium]|nr:glycosyl transferase [Bacteroidota bacterium]
MKILYAVQATGNGHVSRAQTLLPYLQLYGQVNIFLSGSNCHLPFDGPVRYRSQGVSLFYNSRGGLNYWQLLRKVKPSEIWRDAEQLPVKKYDLVINDFDFVTSLACRLQGVPSIHFGHQASFQYAQTPRPRHRSWHGEMLLRHFVKASVHIGLHFESYHPNIFIPVIKPEIIQATPTRAGYITVYLPAYDDQFLELLFRSLPGTRFEVFSKTTTHVRHQGNVLFLPIQRDRFDESLIHCDGIICGAGFETPAEAIHLGKKILAIPIQGQYEQVCNAEALKKMGVHCLPRLTEKERPVLLNWLQQGEYIKRDYSDCITPVIRKVMNSGKKFMQVPSDQGKLIT